MRDDAMAGTDTSYGTWTHSGAPYQVRYSLPVLREIEFHVSEGFRRIPYGGIEHGGLLFGKHDNGTIQIEAFRPIECEHAAGPSFSLSEKDLAGVRRNLASFSEQPELSALVPVGIFISHSRRSLEVPAEEEALLSRLLPDPWQFLLLVKPEKFKPAQFVFVFRPAIETEPFVLPPPARPERKLRSEGRGAVIEASAIETPVLKTPMLETPTIEKPAAEPPSKPKRTRTRKTPAPKLESLSEGGADPRSVASRFVGTHGPSAPPAPTEFANAIEGAPRSRFAMLAALAALLPLAACFLWFYWNYLEPPVDVHAAVRNGTVVVSWPSGVAAAKGTELRVWSNKGSRVIVLSSAQREQGRAEIPLASNDMTIELVAFRWAHERRGMVRVITGQ